MYYWFSVPPRHGKSWTLRYAIEKHLARWPDRMCAYFSATPALAVDGSKDIRRSVELLGWEIRGDTNSQRIWRLKEGGGLQASGIGAKLQGFGYRLIVVDDPVGGENEARSHAQRDAIWRYIEYDILPRLDPDGALFLVHTRWHPDDPIGRVIKRGWEGKNIPALRPDENDPEGEVALLERVAPRAWLQRKRRENPVLFANLYQGEPRTREGTRFRTEDGLPPTFDYHEDRPRIYRVGYGVDLAATAKSQADFSVLVKLLRVKRPESDVKDELGQTHDRDHYYVVDVVRKQVDAPAFALALHAAYRQERGPMLWYAYGMEKATGQFIKQKFPALRCIPKPLDKWQRAQRVSEAWNDGRVFVPRFGRNEDGSSFGPAWVEDFLDEVSNFTGDNDPHDDQVDALSAAFDVLQRQRSARGGSITEDDPGYGAF